MSGIVLQTKYKIKQTKKKNRQLKIWKMNVEKTKNKKQLT